MVTDSVKWKRVEYCSWTVMFVFLMSMGISILMDSIPAFLILFSIAFISMVIWIFSTVKKKNYEEAEDIILKKLKGQYEYNRF